jgi:hypothetical protein
MSDYLAERLKAHAAEQQRKKQAETGPQLLEQQSLQTRGEAFISMNARSEYEHLVCLLNERAEQIRSELGNLPEIVVTGSYIQIGHVALHHYFEQLIPTEPNNQLILSVALAPYKSFMVENPPQAVTHKLTAGAAPDCSRIVWVGIGAGVGSLGEFDSTALAEFGVHMLVEYYLAQTK